jgi:hypothetical protein
VWQGFNWRICLDMVGNVAMVACFIRPALALVGLVKSDQNIKSAEYLYSALASG